MITEQQRAAVTAEVTGPMTAMFSAPYGADAQRAATVLRQYIEDLGEFPRDVLNEAWRNVRRDHSGRSWPSIKTIRQACFDVQVPQRQVDFEGRKSWRDGYWEAVKERCKAFVDGFMSGTLAQQAKAEGWDEQLRQYVRKIAWYQAQIAERCERKGEAFSCRAKDKDGKPLYEKYHIEVFQLEDLERHGDITVSIPQHEMGSMKRRAAFQAHQPSEKPSYMPGASFVDAAE